MKKRTLHLGCGSSKIKGAKGIDILNLPGVDVVHDLNKFPYPFKANQFDNIFAEHILEHLDNLQKVVEEIYRITKYGGLIKIIGPHYTSVDAFTDPTHKHFLTSRSFDYFIPGEDLYKFKYSKAKFKKIKVWIGPLRTKNLFLKIIVNLVNKNLIQYEKHLAYLFPLGVITYELKVIKGKK